MSPKRRAPANAGSGSIGRVNLINRSGSRSVALETTLLAHGVPADAALPLQADLSADVRSGGGVPALVGVLRGRPIVGMTDEDLRTLLADGKAVMKVNTANLGVAMHRALSGATTVSATMELATAAGVRVFATGGLGGVHHVGKGPLDISADIGAFARFPVAVISSGVKAILDVESTREMLETLGVPVIGYRTDSFPAFYLRESAARVDARFDDAAELAVFAKAELQRSGRGVLIVNPIAPEHEIARADWDRWLAQAQAEAAGAGGRDVTPRVLDALHRLSKGATLRANIELVRANARLAGALAAAM